MTACIARMTSRNRSGDVISSSWPSPPSTPAWAATSVLYMRMNGWLSRAMEYSFPSTTPLSQTRGSKSAWVTPSSASLSVSHGSSRPPGAKPGTRAACMMATSGARPPTDAMASFV
ncbi:hypothetical protein BC477_03465 [Clavibacter michiganensis subsp. michiganensis]|uniref:Uncharacterized protein n=1 Tax=Clavibacter michiganensis subsp. michiganensis TaxID=33013 RepID=A0A251XJT7_CLAMM|nr:hypothetical protein BC477_03465 [Clavibacter michiganensis subsp. michiganensis]OUE03772.1 hypothetical protein CMMCAS07_02400 [Clavibacter michiganensis subsp. michiganensis]